MTPLALVGMYRCQNSLVNSAFDTSTTFWSAISAPTTFTIVNTRVRVAHTGSGSGFAQAQALILSEWYLLTFDYEVVSGGLNVTKVGMTSISALTGSGTYKLLFKESDGTNRNLLFQTSSAGANDWYLDNIRLTRVF